MNKFKTWLSESSYITIEDTIYFVDFDAKRLLQNNTIGYSEVPAETVTGPVGLYFLTPYDCSVKLKVDYENQTVEMEKTDGAVNIFAIEGNTVM